MPLSLHITLVFAALLLLNTALKLYLLQRQMRHVHAHRQQVPEAFATRVSLEAHRKAAAYTVARARLAQLGVLVQASLLVLWTLLGGLDQLNAWVGAQVPATAWGGLAQPLALLAVFGFLSALLDLPLEVASTLGVEQRFGFNRSSLRLLLQDWAKGLVVGVLLGGPLLAGLLALMQGAGSLWWLWAWALWMGFQLLVLWVYPVWIAPWFNRFTPLQDEALTQRVQALFARVGARVQGVFVMDGSQRSGHGNAYFTGVGASKRVVLFDTLLARLDAPEVEAVLAHELGHWHGRHVPKRLFGLGLLSLFGLAVLAWVAQQPAFYVGLGVRPALGGGNEALALILFLLTMPLLTSVLGPALHRASRRHEFEADAFACTHSDGAALARALLKLHADNASTLTPDPLVARWTYSHPPAVERLAAIHRLSESTA